MHIYKFRILLEDNDQFFREIDVRANHTFEDFHNVLVTSVGFDGSEMASFYICDSKWKKQQEICLCEMEISEESDIDDDFEEIEKKPTIPMVTMCKTRLKDIINDPHQRIIYVYDFLKMYTFYIELYKIREAESGKEYPLIVKSTGNIMQTPESIVAGDSDENENVLIKDFDELLENESESAGGDEIFEGFYDDTIIN